MRENASNNGGSMENQEKTDHEDLEIVELELDDTLEVIIHRT